MKRTLLLLACWGAMAQGVRGAPLRALADEEMAKVAGQDGVSFAAHIVINDPTLVGAVSDSRLSLGFAGADGHSRYLVLRNVRGTIDMSTVAIDVHTRADGGDYLALTLPNTVKFERFGFESMSVQNDPLAPVTASMGSLDITGTVNMTGQLHLWAH
ncbi:hypothetical protein [Pseudoduganella armeniaca]|nr:hypothetical protein [Pseudoduganella armeniaca]